MNITPIIIRAAAFLIFFVAALELPAVAGVRRGAVTATPFAGGYLFEGGQGVEEHNLIIGGGIGYILTEHIGVEAVLGYIPTEAEPGGRDVNGYVYKIDGLYHFNPGGRLVPYGAIGFGGLTLDPDGGDSRTRAIFNYGAGLQYFITEDIAARGDVRHIVELKDGENNLMYTAGLTFYFGGRAAPAEAKAPAPPAPPAPPAKKAEAPAPAPPAPPAPPAKKAEAPAPKPGQRPVCIELKVEFDFDKAEIKPEYKDELKQAADFLRANPSFRGTIEGGTDAVGSEEYNMGLSVRRANSVKKYLVENFGVEAARLDTAGFGKYNPIDTNLTSEGRQRNRRAVRVYCSDGSDMPAPAPARKCIALKVLFDTGKTEVKPEYHSSIKEVADYMNEHPDYAGTVEGYADWKGPGEENMKISLARAEAVKKYLVETFGIAPERLNTKGFGEEMPIAENKTGEGRAANRYAVQVICEPGP